MNSSCACPTLLTPVYPDHTRRKPPTLAEARIGPCTLAKNRIRFPPSMIPEAHAVRPWSCSTDSDRFLPTLYLGRILCIGLVPLLPRPAATLIISIYRHSTRLVCAYRFTTCYKCGVVAALAIPIIHVRTRVGAAFPPHFPSFLHRAIPAHPAVGLITKI